MTAITKLSAAGTPFSKLTSGRYDGKTISSAFLNAVLIWQFDLWREGYAGATVEIFKEGTTTKAEVYTDLNLSSPASNPQVLLTQTLNGREFGKFTVSLYTPDAYYLVINGIESTGVFYPGIRSLASETATEAWVVSDKGGVERSAGERAGDTIHVRDFGSFLEVDGSTTENTTTLTAALGVAASANGGEVILPAGTFKITTINLPADVTLRGQGRDATVIQSEEADFVVTVTGDNAGMADMTLDGISLQSGSVGLYTVADDHLRLNEVMIKRFATGLKALGGTDHQYNQFFVDNCATNVELRGDQDASSTNLGSIFVGLAWNGGAITQSTSYGLYLRYIDLSIRELTIRDVSFTDNVGTAAISVEGAEQLIFEDCNFSGNTIRHLLTADVTANSVRNMEFRSCEFAGNEIKLGGSCIHTVFDRALLTGALSINANTPTYPILFRDCREYPTVTQTGNTDKIMRWSSNNYGVLRGQTTATVTTATVFRRTMEPGEVVHMDLFATAVQENSAAYGSIKKSAAAFGAAATLSWDTQTGNFTAGLVVTGGTSGATARIQSQTDAGVTGLLNLIRYAPGATTASSFVDNEIITDTGGGTATVDGLMVYGNSVVMLPVQFDHFALSAGATTWNVDVTTSGREVQVKVQGTTTGTIDWNVQVRQNTVISL